MQQKFLSVFTVITLFAAFVTLCHAADRPVLLSHEVVNVNGLERAWTRQISIDGRMTTIEHALLDRDMFFLVTSNSDLIALDAETGTTHWSRHVSNTGLKPLAPAVNTRTVALICGNEAHVFDRRNGRLLWHEVLPATPTAACQLTDYFLYVPLVDQRMVCYPMEELKAPSPGLLALVEEYQKIGYTLDPYSGKVTKTSNLTVSTTEFVTSQQGEKKPAPSQRLVKLVPEYAKIGMVLNPYTGEVTEAGRSVASWWQGSLIDVNVPLKGKNELDELLEEELMQLRKSQRLALAAGRLGDEDAVEPEDANAPYFLKPQKSTPQVCYSFGTTMVQPVIAYDSANMEILTWFSDRGYLFFASGKHEVSGTHDIKDRSFRLQYRIAVTPVVSYMKESKIGRFEGSIARDIVFQPAVVQKIPDDDSSRFLTVVGSASGILFAYDPKTAETRWWQSIGSPIANRPTVVKDKIFVPCLDGNLCCFDSQHGDVLWRSPGIAMFIAASPDRIYVKNTSGELVAVNPADGAQTTLFSIKAYQDVYYNNENDRIYLITNSGLIQCLHEIGQKQPIRHTWLSDAYWDYSETDEERRQLITMPEIPGGVRQPRQAPKVGTPRTQTLPGNVSPDDSPFGSGNDSFDEGDIFENTLTPSTPVTPVTPNIPTQTDDSSDDFGFGDFEF